MWRLSWSRVVEIFACPSQLLDFGDVGPVLQRVGRDRNGSKVHRDLPMHGLEVFTAYDGAVSPRPR